MELNIKNLEEMADFIETVPSKFFNMHRFRKGGRVTPECDSVGCIIGHCTILDKRPLPQLLNGEIDFYSWAEEFTGLPRRSPAWFYLFSSNWADTDDTPTGAAKRIRFFLKNGIPNDWLEQIYREAPLSYQRNIGLKTKQVKQI